MERSKEKKIKSSGSSPSGPSSQDDAKKQQVKTIDSIEESQIKAITLGGNFLTDRIKKKIETSENTAQFSVGFAFFIFTLVIVTFGLMGWNITLSNLYTNKVNQRNDLKNSIISEYEETYVDASELKLRLELISTVEKNTVAYPVILQIWQDISSNIATIKSIELNEDLHFIVNGEANSLIELAKLWHLLTTDERFVDAKLESFGKTETGYTFVFEGNFDQEEILK